EGVFVYPDRIYQSITTPMGEMSMVLMGDDGWMKSPQGTMPLPETMKKNLKENISRDPVYLFAYAKDVQVQYLGEKTFGEGKAIALLVTGKEGTFHLYLDPATYLPTGASFHTIGMQGPADVEEFFSDYRDVAGVKLPFKTLTNANGEKASEVTVKEIKTNVPIDPRWFQKE
ncbi:MAG: hypothetical protein ONB05_08850, partial [candidate division KSB1 bacterium]|nr:hypothetical protein [candidate division KSB1 bacterium]